MKQSLLERQVNEIKLGGLFILRRKVRSAVKLLVQRFLNAAGIIVTAPIILMIVAIRPLKLIRFGTMRSNRIGHFAVDVEAYLCIRDLEQSIHRRVDIIGCPAPVSNLQLQKMWDRTLRITPGDGLWSILDSSTRFWTRGDKHHIKLYDRNTDYKLFNSMEPHLRFTVEEHKCGRELLLKLGIPLGASWICIHNRDKAYLDKELGGRWAYHDYRDFNVQSMISASEELSRRGYYVVRIGSIVEELLKSSDPKIIDYATSSLRSDFMDIYLLSNSAFYLGSDSGIGFVSSIFRKPVSLINFCALELLGNTFAWRPWPLIFKRIWHKEKQRFLSLREFFETGLVRAYETRIFEEAGVELVCNTSEEIRDLAIEVDERLQGQWQSFPEDEELQQRFWDIFRQHAPKDCVGNIQARIGASFLRNNTYLLD